MQWLLIALGGALGAVSRFGAGIWVRTHITESWPLATLSVNVLGSMGIGLTFVLLERALIHQDFRAFLVVGFFGAFTTFSTFSLEVLHMFERGEHLQGLGYVLASVLTCVVGALLGVGLARLAG